MSSIKRAWRFTSAWSLEDIKKALDEASSSPWEVGDSPRLGLYIGQFVPPDSRARIHRVERGYVVQLESHRVDYPGLFESAQTRLLSEILPRAGAENVLGCELLDDVPELGTVASPPTPVAPPADEKPVGRPVSELEDQLRRMQYAYRIPPSALKQLLAGYESNTQFADATQRENAQRTFLVNAIYSYMKSDLELKPGEGMPVSDLRQIALTMPIKAESLVGTSTLQRQTALDNLLSEYEQGLYAPEDRDFYRRVALASFIRENAADPRILEPLEPETTIEALTEDQLCCPRCGGEDIDNSQRLSPQSGNSGDFVTFACRKCGYREEGMDGDTLAAISPWARRRK